MPDEDPQLVRRAILPPDPLQPVLPAGGLVIHRGAPIVVEGSGGVLAHPAARTCMTSMADPAAHEAAFENLLWSIQDEISLLVSVARDEAVAPKTRIGAAKMLHDLAVKALLLRGDIAEANIRHTSRDSDGSLTVERMTTVVRRTQSALSGPPLKELSSVPAVSQPVDSADSAGVQHTAPSAEAQALRRGLATGPAPAAPAAATPDPGPTQ